MVDPFCDLAAVDLLRVIAPIDLFSASAKKNILFDKTEFDLQVSAFIIFDNNTVF